MIELVLKERGQGAKYMNYNFATEHLEMSRTRKKTYILTAEGFVIPNKTLEFEGDFVDSTVYDCEVDWVSESCHIIYCQADSSNNIIKKGKIW